MADLDDIDRRILKILQDDSDQSLDAISDRVALSRNACWRRIRAMEASGVIRKRVALIDAARLGLALTVFILVRTSEHSPDWLDRFKRATREMPEIQGAYRMTGDLDYLIRAQVRDVSDYDRLYQRLIERVEIKDVAASFVMEELKDTTALPL